MVRFLPAVALLAIAACTQEYEKHMVRAEQCRAAETYGQMFGTPDNKGPSWGPLITTSRGFGMEYYHMRKITGRQAIVMYDGNRLISVTLG